jgi:hypothetical protein
MEKLFYFEKILCRIFFVAVNNKLYRLNYYKNQYN